MKKIVFDFAGVLFHWRPVDMLQREVPHLAPDETAAQRVAEAVFQNYGGDWGDFDRGVVDVPELIERIARRTGFAASDLRRIVDAVPHELQALPETVALLRRLRDAGRPLYFISNMPSPYADELEARHGFLDWFRDGVFSCRVHLNKPDPAIFELAAQRFDAVPEDLIFFDDHPPNVESARTLGWNALHFTTAEQAAADLDEHGWG